jgi:hypothetical protein
MDDGVPPILCPRCRKTLYPIAHLRPQASLCVSARIMLLVAGFSAAAIFWTVGLWVWHRYGIEGTVGEVAAILSAVALPPALVPGICIAWLAYRLPRVLRLRCSSCGWAEAYHLARSTRSGVTLKAARPALAPPQSTPRPAGGAPFDQIVDDGMPRDEAAAWAYAELAAGRAVEDVAADLMASGWSQEEAEAMAEDARRETRQLRSSRGR